MNKIVSHIVALLIGFTAGHLATPKVMDAQKVFMAKVKEQFNHKLDSVAIVHAVDSTWTRRQQALQDSIVQIKTMKEFWHKETVRLRKIVDGRTQVKWGRTTIGFTCAVYGCTEDHSKTWGGQLITGTLTSPDK